LSWTYSVWVWAWTSCVRTGYIVVLTHKVSNSLLPVRRRSMWRIQGRARAVGWGTALKTRKVAGSIPDGFIEIFHWHNSSERTKFLGSTQPLIDISTTNISCEVKAVGSQGWQPYHLHVSTLNLLEPSQHVHELLYRYHSCGKYLSCMPESNSDTLTWAATEQNQTFTHFNAYLAAMLVGIWRSIDWYVGQCIGIIHNSKEMKF